MQPIGHALLMPKVEVAIFTRKKCSYDPDGPEYKHKDNRKKRVRMSGCASSAHLEIPSGG